MGETWADTWADGVLAALAALAAGACASENEGTVPGNIVSGEDGGVPPKEGRVPAKEGVKEGGVPGKDGASGKDGCVPAKASVSGDGGGVPPKEGVPEKEGGVPANAGASGKEGGVDWKTGEFVICEAGASASFGFIDGKLVDASEFWSGACAASAVEALENWANENGFGPIAFGASGIDVTLLAVSFNASLDTAELVEKSSAEILSALG